MRDPENLGRQALSWDAGYCALAGAAAVLFASPLAGHLDVPAWLMIVGGLVTLTWSVALARSAEAEMWKAAVAVAGLVNIVAAAGLAGWAIVSEGPGGAVLGLAALQVAAFAVIQFAAAGTAR